MYRLVEQHVSLQMKRKIYVFKVAREERFEVAREEIIIAGENRWQIQEMTFSLNWKIWNNKKI